MFKSDSTASGLREFIERFKKRLMEMAFKEKEASVRPLAISVLVQASDHGFLDSDDMNELSCLVYSEDAKIRTLLKPIVKEIWTDDYLKPLLDQVSDNDESRASIKAFAQFVVKSAHVVDSKSSSSTDSLDSTSRVDQWLSKSAANLSTSIYDRVEAVMQALVEPSDPLEVFFNSAANNGLIRIGFRHPRFACS